KSHQGVSMTPGATTLTRSGFSSTARIGATVRSMPLMAPMPATPGELRRDGRNEGDRSGPVQGRQGSLQTGQLRPDLLVDAAADDYTMFDILAHECCSLNVEDGWPVSSRLRSRNRRRVLSS